MSIWSDALENQRLLSPRSSSLLQTDLSANRLLSCFFTEKEVNGLMEELFETVSNEF